MAAATPPIGGVTQETRTALLDLQRRVALLEDAGGGGGGATYNNTFSQIIEVDTPVAATHFIWVAAFDCTVYRIRARRTGGTGMTVNCKVASSYTNAVDLSCAVADTWAAAVTDATVDVTAGDVISIEIIGATGSPTQLVMQVDFTA